MLNAEIGDIFQRNVLEMYLLVSRSPKISINVIKCLRIQEKDSKSCADNISLI